MEKQQTETHVVVIGAGYAGLLATVRLAGKLRRSRGFRQGPVKITLVNASDMFVQRLRLHELAANRSTKRRPLTRTLRGTGVSFVQGYVNRIDVEQHVLSVKTGEGVQQIGYDKLLYALGSVTDRDSVPGVREYAYTLTPTGVPSGSLSAEKMRERLRVLNETGGRVVVCGGGATGIETAAEFASVYSGLKVLLLTRGVFGGFMGKEGKDVADYMRKSLERLGVAIHEQTTVTEVRPERIQTGAGIFGYDICLWAGGFVAPPLARDSGMSVNEHGQILIDPFMRSVSHPDIFAVGDAAYPVEEPGVKVRMSAFTATIMGAHGADCLSAILQGKTPRPFSFAYIGQGIALGRHNAIGFGKTPDDIPHPPYFTGRVAYAIRELGARFLAGVPDIERWWPGFYFWTGKKRYEVIKYERQAAAQTAARVDASP